MTIYSFMIPVYGLLVQTGKMTIDKNDTTLEQVPTDYVDKVCEWLANNSETNKQITLKYPNGY